MMPPLTSSIIARVNLSNRSGRKKEDANILI